MKWHIEPTPRTRRGARVNLLYKMISDAVDDWLASRRPKSKGRR